MWAEVSPANHENVFIGFRIFVVDLFEMHSLGDEAGCGMRSDEERNSRKVSLRG
jgi:hypothetical protein